MTSFWLVVLLLGTIFGAGLYTNRQTSLAEASPAAAISTDAGDSGGTVRALMGFGLLGGWVVVGGVMLVRAQKRQKTRLARNPEG